MKKLISTFATLVLGLFLVHGLAFAQTYNSGNSSMNTSSSSANTALDPNATATTPGIPSTGAGGYAPGILLIAILAAATAVTGATMVRKS